VQFSVQIGDSQGTSQTNIQYIAPISQPSAVSTRRESISIFGPCCRQLQMESVSRGRSDGGWQVFADDLKPDPATLTIVQGFASRARFRLIPGPATRALQSLQQKGLPIAVAITHLDRSKLSDQQNMPARHRYGRLPSPSAALT